ncbi:hypothetical protein TrVGV298_000163 [Trichoderma virens]|nr:hypothetical protein TrVGV298_000163 [Trichoderma virens]
MESPRPSTAYLIVAIIMAVLIFLNVLIGIAFLLIPKDCTRCRPENQQPARRNPFNIAQGYSLRSIFVSGSHGRRVAFINGFVEVDDDFDAWAYWATDSEETLRGNSYPLSASDAGSSSGSGSEPHHNERMEIPRDGTVARIPAHRTDGGFAFTEYEFEQPMQYATDPAVSRHSHPLAQGNEVDFGPHSQSPAPTVRTWGRDSDATIRAVVENPRRDVGGSRPKSSRSEGQASNDAGRQAY